MKAEAISLRQAALLTATALLAPAADMLPGALARTGGTAGWLAPLFALPFLLLWVWLLAKLFREPQSDLTAVARRGLGPVLGRISTLLYIMYSAAALAAQVGRSSRRLGAVYGVEAGRTLAALAVGLALWLVWRKVSALCRAGELFWLALGVTALGLLALAVPQVEPGRLLPKWTDWRGLPGAALTCVTAFLPAVLGCALLGNTPRRRTGPRRALGWTAALCLMTTLLLGAVVGQMGAGLAARLPQPFFVMVQGLSLQGALARLEALASALWLLADFAYAGLTLAAVRVLAGARWGRWAALAAAGAAVLGQTLPVWEGLTAAGGLLLGIALPALLLFLCKMDRGRKR